MKQYLEKKEFLESLGFDTADGINSVTKHSLRFDFSSIPNDINLIINEIINQSHNIGFAKGEENIQDQIKSALGIF